MDYKSYEQSEKKQTIHRTINTILMLFVLALGYTSLLPIYDDLSGLKEKRIYQSEISQLIEDEGGYVAKPYKDSLGKWTVGFGHLIKDGETFEDLTPMKAVAMLRVDYANATKSVERNHVWANGETKLVLINMTYQLGTSGLSKFKQTLTHLKAKDYDFAAGEMLTSKWAAQTPRRASRLAGRIMGIM